MSEELSNHDVQDGSKNCEFTEHLKESFQHANKILEEEKLDDHPLAMCGCNCRKQVAELQKQLSETRAFCRELESELKTNLTKVNKKISALEASNKEHNSQRADDTNKKDSKPTVLTNSQPDLDARVQAVERSILNSALNLPLQQTMHNLQPASAIAIQQVQQSQLFPMQRFQYPMPQQQGVMATHPYLFFSP